MTPPEKPNNAFLVRCIITLLFVIGGLIMFDPVSMANIKSPPRPLPSTMWLALTVMISGMFLFDYKKREKESDCKDIVIPTWKTWPFSGRSNQAHLAGWCFFSMGLVATARTLITHQIVTIEPFPLSVGTGMLLAQYLFYRLRR